MTTDQKIFLTLCGIGAAVLLLCKKRDGALGALPDGQKILRTQKELTKIWDAGQNGDVSDDIYFRDNVAVFSGRLRQAAKDAGVDLPAESSKKKDIRAAFRVLKNLDGGGLWRHNGQGTERKKEKKKKQSNKYTPWPQENGENIIHIHASYKGTNGDTKWRVGKSGLPNWNNFTMMVRRTLLNNGVSYDDLDAAGVTNDNFIDMEEFRANGGDAYIVDADGKHFLPNFTEDEEMSFERFKKRRAQEKQEKAAEQERERKLSQSSGKQGYAEKLDYARTIGLKGAASTKTEKALNKVIMDAGYDPETFVDAIKADKRLNAWYDFRKAKWSWYDKKFMAKDTPGRVWESNWTRAKYPEDGALNLVIEDRTYGGKRYVFPAYYSLKRADKRGVPYLGALSEWLHSMSMYGLSADQKAKFRLVCGRFDGLRPNFSSDRIDLAKLARQDVYVYFTDNARNIYIPRPSVADKIWLNKYEKDEFEKYYKSLKK